LLKRWGLSRGVPVRRHQAEFRRCLGLDRPVLRGAVQCVHDGMDAHGWQAVVWSVTPEQRRQYTELALDQYADAIRGFTPAAEPVRALREVLQLAHREAIPVALVVMPEASLFRTRTCPEMHAAVTGLLTDLQRQYGLAVIDARDWVEDAGFWDGHHLLPEGAAAFTDRFRGALAPLLQALPDRNRPLAPF
jgi:hypothetical protein